MCETDKSSETCEPTHPAQPNEPGETCQSSALWSDGCVGEFVREFQYKRSFEACELVSKLEHFNSNLVNFHEYWNGIFAMQRSRPE